MRVLAILAWMASPLFWPDDLGTAVCLVLLGFTFWMMAPLLDEIEK